MPIDRTSLKRDDRRRPDLPASVQAVKDEARTLARNGVPAMLALARVLAPLAVAALAADDAGGFVFVNRPAARFIGYPVAELLRRSLWDITPQNALERDVESLWRVFLDYGQQHGAYEV